jgi:quercetin dioxygenase-like cupin family protein
MKRIWILAVLAAVLSVGVFCREVLATPSTATTRIVSQATFGDLDLRSHALPAGLWRSRIRTRGASDLYVVDNTLAPGATTGWHSHPGPSLITVIAGTVTNYEGDDRRCTPHIYPKGSGFVDPGGSDVHLLRNDGTVPAETIAVQLVPKGATRRIDVTPAPGNCSF